MLFRFQLRGNIVFKAVIWLSLAFLGSHGFCLARLQIVSEIPFEPNHKLKVSIDSILKISFRYKTFEQTRFCLLAVCFFSEKIENYFKRVLNEISGLNFICLISITYNFCSNKTILMKISLIVPEFI